MEVIHEIGYKEVDSLFKANILLKEVEHFGGKVKYHLFFDVKFYNEHHVGQNLYDTLFDLIRNEGGFSWLDEKTIVSEESESLYNTFWFFEKIREKYLNRIGKISKTFVLYDDYISSKLEEELIRVFKDDYTLSYREKSNDFIIFNKWDFRVIAETDDINLLMDDYNKLYVRYKLSNIDYKSLKLNETPFNKDNVEIKDEQLYNQ